MNLNRITEEEIIEAINPDDIDLSSFQYRETLNPKIFDKDQKMYSDIRTRLLMIADDFFETLELPWVDIHDISLTGSLANYNWSNFSDVDLHILIDYNEVDENIDLVREYLAAKKGLWNDKHNIKIKGFDVELYAQDVNEEHVSTGVYSVLWDDWLIKPKKEDKSFDREKVKQKTASIIDSYENLFLNFLLQVFKAAQPALLYLVPFTLLPLFLMAYLKGDLGTMWHEPFAATAPVSKYQEV